MKVLIVLATVVALALAGQVRFDNYKVYRATPVNEQQLEGLRSLESSPLGFSFWSEATTVGKTVDVMVAPHLEQDWADFTKLINLKSEVMMDNVQEAIDNQRPKVTEKTGQRVDWKSYNTLEEIHDWLRSLALSNPGQVTLLNAGKSYENRDLLGVKVSFSSANENRGVFIEAGIHAREWISPATVTWILNEILTSTDPAVRRMAENYDWYIFPNYNPDGFVFTHTNNRLWRKTRKPYGLCYGSDPNRNWGYKWMQGGASSSSCSDTYGGSAAFSCQESQLMADYVTSVASKLVAYIGFHSYSQLLLIPYGHQGHEYPTNYDSLMDIGKKSATSLAQRFGTQYTVGNIVDVIYVASGGSMDWVKATYPNVYLSYTYELRDTGRYGFLLPPDQIIPSGQETLDSLVTMFEEYEKV